MDGDQETIKHPSHRSVGAPNISESEKRGIAMKDKLNLLIVFALLLGGAAALAYAQQTRKSEHISVHTDDSTWVMNRRDDDQDLRIRIKGKAEFTDDYSDIKALSPNGSLRVEETRGAITRRFEIETDASGNQ